MAMDKLYVFLTGPGLWITFTLFFGGLIVRLSYLYGLSRERDRVFYNHMSISWATKSILRWLIPLGSASLRSQPVFSLVFFIFHVCLLGVPLFLLAHNMLWDEAFGVSLWSMPEHWADVFTLIFIGCAAFLFVRRLLRPEVRILTSLWDYSLLVLTTLPFFTGFLASHQWGQYDLAMVLHVLFAEILLIIIPLSKLGHIILFFFTRAFIGFEMGSRRGARPW
jgi:nitrate reductase gamma subunit